MATRKAVIICNSDEGEDYLSGTSLDLSNLKKLFNVTTGRCLAGRRNRIENGQTRAISYRLHVVKDC